jgi:hypothetical protein
MILEPCPAALVMEADMEDMNVHVKHAESKNPEKSS